MIRLATDEDITMLVDLLRDFSRELPIESAESAFSPRVASNRLKEGIGLGLCYLSLETDESDPTGFILGNVGLNVWSENDYEITLLAHYMKPDYRKKMDGGRLISAYLKQCDKLIKEYPKIRIAYVMTQPEGTNMNYEKHGFDLMQTTYKKE